ncbi:MAG: flagellar hook-basal body complex protein FliE [Limnobacter sp.]|uniref:flagellar hook-basal body complex protein FliE n=1 Tax=Limnobacter sp. TaxID=2003368 RepID=UPI00391B3058
MSLDISKLDSLISELNAGRVAATGGVSKSNGEDGTTVSFVDALHKAIENVSAAQDQAHEKVNQYITGDSNITLQDMLITSQKADIAFLQMVKSKEKLRAAYTTIMNMPV